MNIHAADTLAGTRTCRLGDLLDFRNDIVYPKDGPIGPATFVGLEHIEPATGRRIGELTIELSEMTGRRARFRTGDIVYGYLRPYLNKVWIAEFDGICSVDQYVFVFRSGVDRDYIAHFLRSDEFLNTAPVGLSPGQLPRIRSGEIADTPIRLPPLDEQRRIAAILDKADALRRKRKRALALLSEMRKATFLRTFGTPACNHLSFEVGTIADLLESTQYGTSDKAGSGGDYPILRMGNITSDGEIDLTDLKRIDLPDADAEKYTVQSGDILFNRTNSAELVGKTAVYTGDAKMAYAGYLVRARAKPNVSPHYIADYLNSPHGKATLRGMAKSIVGMANINAQEMQKIKIIIPPREAQQNYNGFVDALRKRMGILIQQSQNYEHLFASLQHRAFSGQL